MLTSMSSNDMISTVASQKTSTDSFLNLMWILLGASMVTIVFSYWMRREKRKQNNKEVMGEDNNSEI